MSPHHSGGLELTCILRAYGFRRWVFSTGRHCPNGEGLRSLRARPGWFPGLAWLRARTGERPPQACTARRNHNQRMLRSLPANPPGRCPREYSPHQTRGFSDRLRRTTTCGESQFAQISWLRSGFRSEEHTSELQSHSDLVCRLLLEKKNSAILLYTTNRTSS